MNGLEELSLSLFPENYKYYRENDCVYFLKANTIQIIRFETCQ